MQNFIAVIKMSSLGAAYAGVNKLQDFSSARLVELSPIGDQGFILATGTHEDLTRFSQSLPATDIVKSSIVDDRHQAILRSYLSLESAHIEKYVLVLESDFLGELFDWAQRATAVGAKIVDLRLLRTRGSPCYCILTGHSSQEVEPLIGLIKSENKKATLIDNPHPGLVQFMSILP